MINTCVYAYPGYCKFFIDHLKIRIMQTETSKQPTVTLKVGGNKVSVHNPRISYEMLDENGNVFKAKQGRPSNIDSKHYLDTVRKSILRERNELKQGRPIDPTSKRQVQMMATTPTSKPQIDPPKKFVRISVIGVLS